MTSDGRPGGPAYAAWLEKVTAGEEVIIVHHGGSRTAPRISYRLTKVISAGAKRVLTEYRRDLVFERATGTTVSRYDRNYSLLPPTKENRAKLASYLETEKKKEEERQAALVREKAVRERRAILAAQALSEMSPNQIVEALCEQTLNDAYDELVRRDLIAKEET